MTTTYTAHIADPFGQRLLSVVNFVEPPSGGGAALDYVLNVGKAGVLLLTVPLWTNPDLFRLDGRITVERSINGRVTYIDGDACYLIRSWLFDESANTLTVAAYHANSLLSRRIVAYAAGSSYTSKAATFADDLIKAFWSQNFAGGISAANRDGAETQANISAYVGVQANLSQGASVGKACARRNVAEIVQEICEASTTAGTYLAAEIIAPTEATLELRTYAGQRGVDHRAGTATPIIFSAERGNLENGKLTIDHSQEITFVIAGGSGTEADRLVATASDATRMSASPLNRIEQFVDMSNVGNAAQLQDEADAALRAGRPQILVEGDLVETPSCTRGIHFNLGDICTARVAGQQVDVRLDTIHVSVSSGDQRTRVQFRSVL